VLNKDGQKERMIENGRKKKEIAASSIHHQIDKKNI
jgi:hypothetical protein